MSSSATPSTASSWTPDPVLAWLDALTGRRALGADGRPLWPVTLREDDVAARGLARGAESVVLRPIRLADEAAWGRLRIDDDERLGPWEATLPPGTGERRRDFRGYVRAQHREAVRGTAMPFALEVDGVLAGQVSVGPIAWGSLRSATVGYWIGGPWEGRGLMRLAVAMTLDHLLSPAVGLHRVEIDVRPENDRSLAVCRRLGLREEGERRGLMHIAGAWSDHVAFVLLSEELTARSQGLVAGLAAEAAGDADTARR